ncbi:MAG: hypothetical protein RIB67_01490 [Miltoncostaeaceae bacterium]
MAKAPRASSTASVSAQVRALLRAPDEGLDLDGVDARGTPGCTDGKDQAEAERAEVAERLAADQEILFANGRAGAPRSLLVILQGMDTAGKGGTLRHVMGALDPQGVQIAAFKRPTEEELEHHFLWRIRRRLPAPGMVGVFDRSHYEDVIIARVRELVPPEVWEGRYAEIARFEWELQAAGTRVVKCLLHISREESRERLLARLDDPTKHWKYAPGDVDERELWGEYRRAYEAAVARCGPAQGAAPWYVVPADRKWYRNWAIAHIVAAELEEMELAWPPADFDVEGERERLLAQG